MATDIAFVVGALALLGRRVPTGLKVFLLALAIVDDIGAILVIAVAYSRGLDLEWLAIGGLGAAAVIALRALRAASAILYLIPGFVLWLAAFKAGIHPTLAGVILGILVPARPIGDRYVLDELESRLHPISSFAVVPLFALANAGVALSIDALGGAIGSAVFWGIVGGLILGKGLGIFGTSLAAERLHVARRPADVTRFDLAGGSVLAGIGFTVSLFLTGLAFESETLIAHAKIGVLGGSFVSAITGAALLSRSRRISRREVA
jgi:NhaA family Na+:H+ antiporter